MMKIVIVGGGWAGCAAAVRARKAGAQTVLLERTDSLLGTGLVGGIFRNNGRFTAAEECIAMGCGELFCLLDAHCLHKNVDFPGHAHASLYNTASVALAVERYLDALDIEVYFNARVTQATCENGLVKSVLTDRQQQFQADAFVDATGTAGPMSNCIKYGNGCAMCVLRCPSFGGRVSLCALAGVEECTGERSDGALGAMSGSCKLLKSSLAPSLVCELQKAGALVIPLPQELRENHLEMKACIQYALAAFRDNIILLDTGYAKLMTPYFPLKKLHQVAGFEAARYADPYAGGVGNSMRFFAMARRDETLCAKGMHNLFCAGEKAGPLVGHTEAIVTGSIAGCNAARCATGEPPLVLPRSLAVGEGLYQTNLVMNTTENPCGKLTFSGSHLFEILKEKNLYTVQIDAIVQRVKDAGLWGVFDENTSVVSDTL